MPARRCVLRLVQCSSPSSHSPIFRLLAIPRPTCPPSRHPIPQPPLLLAVCIMQIGEAKKVATAKKGAINNEPVIARDKQTRTGAAAGAR